MLVQTKRRSLLFERVALAHQSQCMPYGEINSSTAFQRPPFLHFPLTSRSRNFGCEENKNNVVVFDLLVRTKWKAKHRYRYRQFATACEFGKIIDFAQLFESIYLFVRIANWGIHVKCVCSILTQQYQTVNTTYWIVRKIFKSFFYRSQSKDALCIPLALSCRHDQVHDVSSTINLSRVISRVAISITQLKALSCDASRHSDPFN